MTDLNDKDWFEDDNYDLCFIRANEELAGFVIIKRILEEDMSYLNHFFVLRKYRRKQVGKQAEIKAFNMYHGNWRVSEFD